MENKTINNKKLYTIGFRGCQELKDAVDYLNNNMKDICRKIMYHDVNSPFIKDNSDFFYYLISFAVFNGILKDDKHKDEFFKILRGESDGTECK